MATEVVTITWCDVCLDDDDKVKGDEFPLAIDASNPRVIGLCPRHRTEVYDVIEHLISLSQPAAETATSAKSGRQSPSQRPARCGECGKEMSDASGLRKHLHNVHRMTMGDYRQKHGDSAPTSKQVQPERITCPVCGQVYSWAAGNNRPRQALGGHLRQAHDTTLMEHSL